MSLAARDGQLRANWYVACLSRELGARRPIARTVYEQHLVLYRDASGKAVCLPDRCLHRNAPLAAGRIREGCLVCPYHGWTYDGAGNVTEIPSEGNAPRSHFRLLPVPTLEQDGCIWIWCGDGPPDPSAPPFRCPHADDREWISYFMITDFANEVTHLAENFMDVPHTAFVHEGWFRRRTRARVPIRVERGATDVLVTYLHEADEIGFTGRLVNPRKEPVRHTDRFILPNLTRVDYHFGERRSFLICSQCTPVGEYRTRVYTQIAYRLPLGMLLEPFFRFYTRRVIEQDVAIMKLQGGNLQRYEGAKFHHTAADVVHVSIEQLREAAARGELRESAPQTIEKVIWT